jgi:hypothetical protein
MSQPPTLVAQPNWDHVPRSRNLFELQPNHVTLFVYPITHVACALLNNDTLCLGHEMVDFVLEFITSHHALQSDILFFSEITSSEAIH